MERREFCVLVIGAVLSGGVADAAGERGVVAASAALSRKVLWVIPHTHWEGAVFKTREEYLAIGLPHILQVLDLLAAYPDYRFVLDQVAYVRPFLERYPEQVSRFRGFVREGRLQIVGGTDVMDDVNMPGGESWIRQIVYGKHYFRATLGIDVTVGWALDTFGHHAQMPQLLRLAGLHSYWFQRGVPDRHTPSEFLWQGIDGTRIPAFWLPEGYGWFYGAPQDPAGFARFARDRYATLGEFSPWPERVALEGVDVSPPEVGEPPLLEGFDRGAGNGLHLRFGVPTEFEKVVANRPSHPVVTGELNPVFQGVYSSRIELKQRMRADETVLTSAERLTAFAGWLGTPVPLRDLEQAWEPALFNQAHDLMSGTMVDKVYRQTLAGDEFANRLAQDLAGRALTAIAREIDTRGPGVPLLVFNTLGWERSDYVEAEIGFDQAMTGTLGLLDAQGRSLPVQILESIPGHSGGIIQARIGFVAQAVPGLGYEVYRVVEQAADSRPEVRGGEALQSTAMQDTGILENSHARVKVDLWTGAVDELWLKSEHWNALRAPGNIVACEPDGGDLWELSGTLNGNRRVAMAGKQHAPRRGRAGFSDETTGGNGVVRHGPVYSEFHVAHPFVSGQFSTRLRLYQGLQRIDVRTTLRNEERLVRYRVLFPVALRAGKRTDEIPFGALGRPQAKELPAQNWMDFSDGQRGLCLLNRGLPGNNTAGGTMLLSLLRSARISAYAYEGGYEPGISSDTGLELGADLHFEYSLLPHTGDWRAAQPWRAGAELNHPLLLRTLSIQPGRLPGRWGMLQISPATVVLSAFKPAHQGDAMVLRVYEAAGQPARGTSIRFRAPLQSIRASTLMEEEGAPVSTPGNTLVFDLRPFQIQTFLVRFSPAAPAIRPA